MAAPFNPKGKAIDALIGAFMAPKTVAAQLRVPRQMVYARLAQRGWRQHYISDEERRFLLARRQAMEKKGP